MPTGQIAGLRKRLTLRHLRRISGWLRKKFVRIEPLLQILFTVPIA
jgi:hypothetical protein